MGRRKGVKNGQTSAATKACTICGNEYLVKLSKADKSKYCSMACRHIGIATVNAKPTSHTCPICNQEFITAPRSTHVYCSHKCAALDNGRKVSGNKNGNFLEKISRPCPICGVVMTFSPNNKSKIYCSRKCHNASLITPLVSTICQVCGKEQFFTPFIAERRKYCSLKCAHEGAGKSYTSIEIAIADGLAAANIDFVPQYEIAWYSIDIAIPDKKIAIECDGDYWHSLPKSIARDKAKDTFLTNKGWTIIRLPEHLIRSDLKSCIDRISETLNSS